jgi:pimeloyl-ACP methyl ester carboxylesterase
MSAPTDFAFLHGGGQGGWVWNNTIAALRRQTEGAFGRALALDVPGCGNKRDRKTDELLPGDVSRELIADLEHAGMKGVVLVGHSQAGSVMPAMVEIRPKLFRRLIYVSCSIPLPGQTVLQMMGTGRHGSNENEVGWPADFEINKARQRYPSMFCNDMDEAGTAAFRSKIGPDAWPMQMYSATNWHFDNLASVPASYVICLRDGILPVAWQEIFATRLKATERIRIDAGHQVMNTRPHALAEILRLEAMRDSSDRSASLTEPEQSDSG